MEKIRTGRLAASKALVALVLVLAAALLLAGCATSGGQPSTGTSAPPSGGMGASAPGATPASDIQMCAECGKKGMPVMTEGTAKDSGGKQVVAITVKDGFYSPNKITAASGTPIEVVFSGKAKGCLAKPKFEVLGKQTDFTSGNATLDLGNLQPGIYKFTCGMGMNAGTITVR